MEAYKEKVRKSGFTEVKENFAIAFIETRPLPFARLFKIATGLSRAIHKDYKFVNIAILIV